jgi:hypothetical protein
MTGSAKQSRSDKKGLDCFVASAPRNDVARNSADEKAAHQRGFRILKSVPSDQRVTTTGVPTETRW